MTTDGRNDAPQWIDERRLRPFIGARVSQPSEDDVLGASGLVTRGAVLELHADGSRVAIRTRGRGDECDHILLWNVRTQTLRRLNRNDVCTLEAVRNVVLAGAFATWIDDYYGGNHEEISIASLGELVTNHTPVGGGGSFLGNVVGHGTLIAFNSWQQRTGSPSTMYDVRLRARRGDRSVVIARGKAVFGPIDTDGRRLLIRRLDGGLSVLDADGRLLNRFASGPDTIRGARIDGDRVVVLTRAGLVVYDARSGVVRLNWALANARGTSLADLDGGVVVFITANQIHLLRLADGRTAIITRRAVALAQLEQAGLFYSTALTGGSRRGGVRFIPISRIRRLLA